ncbi:zinc finger related protein [Volvox carteri f. nagariensis]|uniref:Zinc finger related protein n=1 Tax=Volvox carteri f. nagariensis TaxID=3068 RepID=D8TSE5_VOLCA|nr:zinc finger related protein [Volvox carteri f. nagariensis]EFJ49682.1 zinc finger related protein [Volvox carteri f. nagariensis]|eukprot:XP_002949189.1 zinc finger related protein [Volvox carteri f. nagariensis]
MYGRERGPPPPPPPGMMRGPPPDYMDRGPRDYPPRDIDRRRPRSPPPPMHERDRYGRGRSPPPIPKRSRRDGPYDRDFHEPPFGRGSPEYDRRPPSPKGAYDEREAYERRGSVGRERPEEEKRPMTFKEFTLRKVPDDAAPDVAHRMFQEYLVEYYGSAIKAEFEQNKDSDVFKYQFDPRYFAKVVASRAEEAQDSAKHIAADVASGALDPSHENFCQGMYDLAPKVEKDKQPGNAEEGPKFAPNLCWRMPRVAHDLDLSRKLIRKLDAEKGIEENPLIPKLSAGASGGVASAADGAPEGDGAGGDAAAPANGGESATDGPPNNQGGGAVTTTAVPAGGTGDEEPAVVVSEANYTDSIGKLDLQLHWLWKVHGVDYYAGIELNEQDWPYRLNCCRLIRGPKPEEGESEEGAEKAEKEKLTRTVDETWKARIAHGDPIEAKCLKARIEEELDKWIESQVTMVADNKWGSKLSNKLFVGKKYVIKHIKTKHQDKLAAERERILDMLYFENFRTWKEDEERRRSEEEHHAGEPMEGEGAGMEGEGGYSGRGRGRGGVLGARGRGRGPGRGMMGRGPMMGMEGPMMVPMPMAPMFIPPGPMGPFMPIIPGPVPLLPPGPIPIRGRGPRPLRGRGIPGRGMGPPKIDPRGMREYFDLDHPANNRAVLDYGDL